MNNKYFQEKILSPLKKYSSEGDFSTDSGSIAIGHMPSIAPFAYKHIIYPPLGENEISILKSRLHPLNVHQSLLELYRCSNGMHLFLRKGFRVFGYVPLDGDYLNDRLRYPADIMSVNGNTRVKGSHPTDLTIGWYISDGSYVNLQENGSVVKFMPNNSIDIIHCWSDIDDWLFSEIQRLNSEW